MSTATLSAPAITDAQVEAYLEEGFLVVDDLLASEDLGAIRADLVDLARGRHSCPGLPELPVEMDDEAVLRRVLCIHQPHHVSPVIRRMVDHPALAAVLSRLCGAHLPWWDGRVKCMQSMLFVKPPGKPGQAWHQDERYIPTRDRSLTGAWIALDDATVANGCLWVIPGSHRSGYMHPVAPPADLDEFDGAEEAQGVDARTAVPVEVRAGSVVFFNGYLLHRSLRNRSQTWRRALVNHYMNAWSLLPWYEVPGEGSVGIADNRSVMPVAGDDPYAWKGCRLDPAAVHLRAFRREA